MCQRVVYLCVFVSERVVCVCQSQTAATSKRTCPPFVDDCAPSPSSLPSTSLSEAPPPPSTSKEEVGLMAGLKGVLVVVAPTRGTRVEGIVLEEEVGSMVALKGVFEEIAPIKERGEGVVLERKWGQ